MPRAESVRLAPRPLGSHGVAHYHFARVWAGRNDDRVVVFAGGHVYDRAERRRSLRQLVGMMRRERDEARATARAAVLQALGVTEEEVAALEAVEMPARLEAARQRRAFVRQLRALAAEFGRELEERLARG